MTMTAHFTDFLVRLGLVFQSPDRATPPSPVLDPVEDLRARRQDCAGMIDACPDAFRSEQDVQTMMYMLPGRF
jgi:hypothetical protein